LGGLAGWLATRDISVEIELLPSALPFSLRSYRWSLCSQSKNVNMSFGFSPGDIVLFVGFVEMVVKALQDSGGSKSEYQLAVRQCQGFLSMMDEIKSYDFPGLPQSIRDKLGEYTTDTQQFIHEFKSSIEKYNKSMNENSDRGWFRSAPRKVQWAFMAADDLEKFTVRLSAQSSLRA
jgi:hypothetical protein